MAIPLYLAKTAAEFARTKEQPEHLAWMACHFSPYGTGLTNLPSKLPENSLLILNDRTPVHGHDPVRIKETVEQIIAEQNCSGVLLDFQRPNEPETEDIVSALLTLPRPVCVSELYARESGCPVFLPPVPLTVAPEDYLAPWQGREIWLEVSAEQSVYAVAEKGCTCHQSAEADLAFYDDELNCHYRIDLLDDSIHFTIGRSRVDCSILLEKASAMGVTKGIGLWQELYVK